MQDAACLECSRVTDGRLFLFTQKTGTPVYCPLPPEVVTALATVPNGHADYIFWDGKSTGETTVKSWNRVFNKLFATANPPIEGGHPHRFRDTFAVSLLLKGTRVTLRTVLASLAEGATTAEILADFPTLTEEDVRAAIAFAATSAQEDLPLAESPVKR